MIPAEARRKSKNGSFDSQEPTSPKVSCMGQIKHKKKVCKSKCVLPTTKKDQYQDQKTKKTTTTKPPKPNKVLKPSSSSVGVPKEDRKLINANNNWGAKNYKPSSVSDDHKLASSLDQMKRFASGRDTLANFDWKAHDRNCDFDDEEKEEDEVFIAHSAPLMVGGGGRVALEPKKEVNLWKRRTMAPPRPLQINVTTKPK
ncbi:hypothetical protein BVC80_1823g25 [Macleaya cordata]|uniref:Syringolide-induced protein 14-1-1 n=1 Tax=Macleaya cordata TaxID=56857 RepID=A0A200QZY7_MACCD|nr:hypothetical protein BVC80_1823g25 [Macleaya cordata]